MRRVRYTTDIMRGVGALLRRKDGQLRPVEYRIVPVTEEGTSVGTVLVFRDVSERVRLDNLLKDMQTTAQDRRLGIRRRHAEDSLDRSGLRDPRPAVRPADRAGDAAATFFIREDRKKLHRALRSTRSTPAASAICSCA